MNIKDGIREDGTVDDHEIETYYKPLEAVWVEDDSDFVRVIMDDGGVDAETRIPFEAIEQMGFTSLRSGAGVDGLQHRCSTGVFGELDWSPGVHQQCIWRIDREGQKNPVSAFFLVTDDGSDPPMMDVLGLKASEANNIIDPHLGVQVKNDDKSHIRRLVERYLSKKDSKQLQLCGTE